jgi:predicted phage terminase large subunit-like protein
MPLPLLTGCLQTKPFAFSPDSNSLNQQTAPGMYSPQQPTPQQQRFLDLTCREALYGGAAGGGKSSALLMAALQYVDVPGYAAIIFRRTYADLALPGALMDRAQEWLGPTAARWNTTEKTWQFPSGATLSFGYLEHPADRFRYQSAEFQFCGMDELTQLPEVSYRYLFSRLRRLVGAEVPIRMRGATNPGGIGHEWVRRRFLIEGDAHGRVFVPAKLEDNPYLDAESYRQSLAELDPVTRQQLEAGDWDVRPEGTFFQRKWLTVTGDVPARFERIVRFWDLSAGKGDYTAGVLLGMAGKDAYVLDVQRYLLPPGEQEAQIAITAELDDATYGPVPIRIEQEGAAGGAFTVHHFVTGPLAGRDVLGAAIVGSKQQRAGPFAAACQNRLVQIAAAPWTRDFLDELLSFPDPHIHDDQVDAVAGAYNQLTSGRLAAASGFVPSFGKPRRSAF